eukprot:1501657-Pyramimonas_sp.AAC.1
MEGETQKSKVMFTLSPDYDIKAALEHIRFPIEGCQLEFHAGKLTQAMAVALHKAGGHRPVGGGPKVELDRVVERQLKSLQEK